MSSNLIADLTQVNLIKQNIKNAIINKGQTVTNFLSYPGAIENISGGAGGVKLFKTKEEMQQDTTAQEGDLAVVYREEIQPVTEESEFDSCTFPNTVVLDEAFTGRAFATFRSTGSSSFDGNINMSSSGFSFIGKGDSGRIYVEYISQNGITYTRRDGGEELQEFGTTIKWASTGGSFNNVIGNFMKIKGNYFDGLYKYELDYPHTDIFVPVSGFTYIDNNIKPINTNLQVNITNTELFNKAIQASKDYESITSSTNLGIIFCDNDFSHIYIYTVNKFNMTFDTILFDRNDVLYFTVGAYKGQTITDTITGYDYDINSETVSPITLNQTPYSTSTSDYIAYSGILGNLIGEYYNNKFRDMTITYREDITDGTNIKILERFVNVLKTNEYVVTKSQLNATSDYVYEKTFYGKNGVEVGTLQNKENLTKDEVKRRVNIWSNYNSGIICPSDISSMFSNCTSLTTIPLLDTSNVTNMYCMFDSCKNLTTIPLLDTSNATSMYGMFNDCTSLTTIPLLDTSNVTDMSSMFSSCKNLTTIPQLDTSNATSMYGMFNDCTSLTTIPLLDTSSATDTSYMFSRCTSLTTIPLLDTSNVTNMSSMFYNCKSLTTIPLLDTKKVTNMGGMFYNCTSLSDESLNNILVMCKNAVKITLNKTLKYIGLTSEQANKCKTLSNYSAFTSAGWTTGY